MININRKDVQIDGDNISIGLSPSLARTLIVDFQCMFSDVLEKQETQSVTLNCGGKKNINISIYPVKDIMND